MREETEGYLKYSEVPHPKDTGLRRLLDVKIREALRKTERIVRAV
jgi:hypothetical protein